MFPYVCKKIFHISRVRITQKVNAVIMRNLPYNFFYLKTKISVDFQICMSVPLIINIRQTIQQLYLGTLVMSIALLRSSCSQMFFKLGVLKTSQISEENTCVGFQNSSSGCFWINEIINIRQINIRQLYLGTLHCSWAFAHRCSAK